MKRKHLLLIPVVLFLSACDYPFLHSVYKVMDATGEATAVAIDEHHMITNNHVCQGQTTLTAEDVDGKQIQVSVVEIDPIHDLCLLKTRATLKPMRISKDKPRVGQKILTFGNADGDYPVLLSGYLGKTDTVLNVKCRLITSLTFPGSSGSPVIEESSGKMLGLVFAENRETHFGYMIPASDVIDFLKICGIAV